MQDVKRFMLFGGDEYYAAGGFNDYLGSHATIEEATAAATHCD